MHRRPGWALSRMTRKDRVGSETCENRMATALCMGMILTRRQADDYNRAPFLWISVTFLAHPNRGTPQSIS